MPIDNNRTAVVNALNAMPIKKKDPAAVALGRKGGAKATEAQKQAARRNGLLGGRPKSLLVQRKDRES